MRKAGLLTQKTDIHGRGSLFSSASRLSQSQRCKAANLLFLTSVLLFSPDAAGALRLGQPVDPEVAMIMTPRAFEMWFFVYLALFVYAVFQARKRQAGARLHLHFVGDAAVACACTCVGAVQKGRKPEALCMTR